MKNEQQLQKPCFAVIAPFVLKVDVVTSAIDKENTTISVTQYMARTITTKSLRNFTEGVCIASTTRKGLKCFCKHTNNFNTEQNYFFV